MIKARVLSTTMSAKPDAPIEVNMEMWVFDNGSLSCPDEVVIMTEEEYKALDSVSDVLRKSLLDEREKTKKLREECESTVGFCPDGTIVFRSKKVSELEKEVEKLKDELNKKQRVVDIVMDVVDVCSDLKERINIYEDC